MSLNAGICAQASLALPAGMEYEKVSPADKGDADIFYQGSTVRSSEDGSRVTYQTPSSFPGSRGSFAPNQGLGTLTTEGWTTRGIMPRVDPNYTGANPDNRAGYQIFSDDLAGGAFVSPGPALTSDAETGVRNAYRTDFATGAYSLLTPPPVTPMDPGFALFYSPAVAGGTPDLSHVIFETSGAELTPDAPVGMSNAYEWVGGTVRLIGILPDGTVAPGGAVPGRGAGGGLFSAAADEQFNSGAISSDGARIFFTTPGGRSGTGAAGEIYVRENGRTSRLVSVSRRSTPDPDGPEPATFQAASSDGRVVLFTSTEKLTDDSTANNGNVGGLKIDLYRYDIDADRLTDLSATIPSAGGLVGTNEAMTTVYFGTATDDIYMWRDGATKLVASSVAIGAADRDWPSRPLIIGKQSDVSPDGRYMVYSSTTPHGGSDPGGAAQLFLYDADADATTCLTCGAVGASVGESYLRPFQSGAIFIRPYLPRNIDRDSTRVFFETPQDLVPEDTNGKSDVYQYEFAQKRAVLISSGRGEHDAHFGDASADGSSVFIVTQNQLIPGLDEDQYADVYVARTGATKRQDVTKPLPCDGDQCQGPLPPTPHDDVPGSVVFSGSDDLSDESPRLKVFRVAPITSKQRRTWSRTGRVQLSVRVSDAGRVNAVVRGKLGKRTRLLARASKSTRGGGTIKLTLRLSNPARRYLAQHGRLRVVVAVSYSDGGEGQRATLLLRRPSNSTTTRGAR